MRSPMPFRRRARRRSRTLGQSLVEFGLVLPVLMLVFAGAADFGRIFYGFVALENAVKEGALFGARYPLCDVSSTSCIDPDNVRWRVQEEAKTVRNADGTKITPTVQCVSALTGTAHADLRSCAEGDVYVVSATYRLELITPILGAVMGDGFTLESESSAVVMNEAFDPTAGVAPTKLILAADARNRDEIRAKCEQPDPTGSPDYYRSPCVDITAPGSVTLVKATYRSGDTIRYKFIVRNNGGTNLTGVQMFDSQGWPSACGTAPNSMPVNAPAWTCTYSKTAPSVSGSGNSSDYENVLTVDALEVIPTTDGATVTIERPPADLRVLKYVSPYKEGADGDGWISGTATFGTTQSLDVYRDSGDAVVWYKVIVTNIGGQTATGVTITDTNGSLPFGQNNNGAVCDAAPTNMVVGARFECRYRVTHSSNGTAVNTARAQASNATPDSNDDSSATVRVDSCSGGNKVVPNLIGLTKSAAQTAWTNAGFTGALNAWSGQNSDLIVTQNRQAFGCMAPSTTITVTRTNT